MSGNNTNSRTGFLSISVALLALAGPAVAQIAIEGIDQDFVFCAPVVLDGTVKVGFPYPYSQTVTLISSRPDVALPAPPILLFPPLGGTLPFTLAISPVAEPTEVTLTATHQNSASDQVTFTILPNQPMYFVDAAAPDGGDGSSWSDAFNDLQVALAGGAECPDIVDEIWVAAGTYYPGGRDDSFYLISDVGLYGGFLGTAPGGGETSREQRDYVANETILSGEIGGAGNSDNTYHVVNASGTSETAILDGFTIRGGYASGSGSSRYGGGMYNAEGDPTVRHCVFEENNAVKLGGGMYNTGNPTLIDCLFYRNSAWGSTSTGGGMHSEGDATLIECMFSENSATDGGGLYTKRDATLIDCTFSENSATDGGGGMRIAGGAPTLMGCTFDGNGAAAGGGAYIEDPTYLDTSATLTNCEFNGNEAALGGGIYNSHPSSVLANCTFADNIATVHGGGVCSEDGDPTLTNCTFGGNSAQGGEALYAVDHSYPVVTNCILWDGGDEIEEAIYSSATVTYSDVRGGWEGEGNIDDDPLFADPLDGDLRLSAGSPCIDAANSLPTLSFDADGKARAVDDPYTPNTGSGPADFVDMGAYEYRPAAAFADFDGDGDVDLADAAEFFLFFNGPL